MNASVLPDQTLVSEMYQPPKARDDTDKWEKDDLVRHLLDGAES